jgi:hypothetical protein
MSYLLTAGEWSVNLRAIENCIFGIRSIGRNMLPILRTVLMAGQHGGPPGRL